MNDMEVIPSWDERHGLYRGHTPITAEQVSAWFPEAMVLFDVQCPHLAERPDTILCVNKKGRLSAEPPDRDCYTMRTIWRPEIGLWIRYSTTVGPLTDVTQVCVCCRWEYNAWAFGFKKDERRDICDRCHRLLVFRGHFHWIQHHKEIKFSMETRTSHHIAGYKYDMIIVDGAV